MVLPAHYASTRALRAASSLPSKQFKNAAQWMRFKGRRTARLGVRFAIAKVSNLKSKWSLMTCARAAP
jgi:hypothetical protein